MEIIREFFVSMVSSGRIFGVSFAISTIIVISIEMIKEKKNSDIWLPKGSDKKWR